MTARQILGDTNLAVVLQEGDDACVCTLSQDIDDNFTVGMSLALYINDPKGQLPICISAPQIPSSTLFSDFL